MNTNDNRTTRGKRLGAAIYRKELRAVANGEDSGPHPIPTDEQIGAVLGDLDDETATAESEATA